VVANARIQVASTLHLGARKAQEDCILVDSPENEPLAVFILCDGMGGHGAGDKASALVAGRFYSEMRMQRGAIQARELDVPTALKKALHEANMVLRHYKHDHPETKDMGSTLVAAAIFQGGLYWVSVGDSLLYLYRGQKLMRLNEDHSMASQIDAMIAKGMMTEEEGRRHPSRNVLRSAVAGAEIKSTDCPEAPLALEKGDMILIASDGIETLSPEEIGAGLSLSTVLKLSDIAGDLIEDTIQKGKPNQDNIALVIASIGQPSLPVGASSGARQETPAPAAKRAPLVNGGVEVASDALNRAFSI
jgi:serine/threonine protein phosphatase PrpC